MPSCLFWVRILKDVIRRVVCVPLEVWLACNKACIHMGQRAMHPLPHVEFVPVIVFEWPKNMNNWRYYDDVISVRNFCSCYIQKLAFRILIVRELHAEGCSGLKMFRWSYNLIGCPTKIRSYWRVIVGSARPINHIYSVGQWTWGNLIAVYKILNLSLK
jgi:hypothetical protein